MIGQSESASSIVMGEQLRKARELVQFRLDEVAREMGISAQEIDDWEHERSKPNLRQLESLARLYGREIDYFLTETPDPPADVKFRGKPERSLIDLSREARLVLAEFEELCRTTAELEEFVGRRREVILPTYSAVVTAMEAAQSLRDRYQLGDRPIDDLRGLLEDAGVRVFELGVATDEVSGFSFWHSIYGPCILVNARDLKGRRNFTLAHELAHVLYRDGSSLCYIPVKIVEIHGSLERRAHRFAVEFLLPRSGVSRDFDRRNLSDAPTEKELSQMGYKWNTSLQALGYRLEELRLILKGHTNKVLEPKARFGRRPKTPRWERKLGRTFVELSLEAYSKNLISLGEFSRILGIPVRKAIEVARGK